LVAPNAAPANAEALQQARLKQAEPILVAVGRIGVSSASPRRSRMLAVSVLGGLRGVNSGGAWLRARRLPRRLVARRISRRQSPTFWLAALNASELLGPLALPLGEPQLPGLPQGVARHLVPGRSLSRNPDEGIVLGDATFPGAQGPVVARDVDRLTHSWLLGPTGSGKSVQLLNGLHQDMLHGHPVVALDPIGDFVEKALDVVPSHRLGDVIVLDPGDSDRPVGLNPLDAAVRSPDLVVDQIVGAFRSIFKAFWGPRTDDVMRASLLTLVATQDPEDPFTLAEVPLILSEPNFRRRLVSKLDDPIGLEPFWAWYEGLSEAERAQVIGPISNKLRSFLLRPALRNVIGQARPPWSMEAVIEQRRILLVPLRPGVIGQEAANLLGSLLVARLWQAVQQRASLPADRRHPVFAYIDEFQNFLNLPTPVGDVLAMARNLGCGLTLAHQHTGQLTTEIRRDVMANARTKLAFQLGVNDAKTMAPTFSPMTAQDLQGLGEYEAVSQLAVGRNAAPPVTLKTLPPPQPLGIAEAVRARSQERYGSDLADIEAQLRARRNAHQAENLKLGRVERGDS